MNVIRVNPDLPEPGVIRAAVGAIRRGELVIFPTETVYGLAADALNEAAVRRVFEAKGRGQERALPVQVAGIDQLPLVAGSVPDAAIVLARRFWPGPLTLVLPKADAIPEIVTGGGDTIGVRIPDHPVALALLRELGTPIVATSANLSGEDPATTAELAMRALGDAVSLVLDAGECSVGVASTVVDLTVSPASVVREGVVPSREIDAVIAGASAENFRGESPETY